MRPKFNIQSSNISFPHPSLFHCPSIALISIPSAFRHCQGLTYPLGLGLDWIFLIPIQEATSRNGSTIMDPVWDLQTPKTTLEIRTTMVKSVIWLTEFSLFNHLLWHWVHTLLEWIVLTKYFTHAPRMAGYWPVPENSQTKENPSVFSTEIHYLGKADCMLHTPTRPLIMKHQYFLSPSDF